MGNKNKQKVISFLCFLIGIIIVCGSIWCKGLEEIVLFAGAMMMTGSFIFWDGWIMQLIFKNRAFNWKPQIRLLVYVLIGIVLLKVPMAMKASDFIISITKAFGMALLLLSMWKFYSFTTRVGVQNSRKEGCDGTGDCRNCGRSDICSSPDKEK